MCAVINRQLLFADIEERHKLGRQNTQASPRKPPKPLCMAPAYLDLAKLLPSSAAIRAEALLPSPFDSP